MRLVLALLLTLAAAPALAAPRDSGTGGGSDPHPQEGAITSEEVDDYLTRKGLSLKDPKALDKLPNPMEVLRYQQELKLTPEQRAKAQQILEEVNRDTTNAAKVLVQAEKELSQVELDRQQERALTERIRSLEGEVRWNQQSFGQMMKSVLSPSQAKQLEDLEKADAEKRR